MKRLLILLFTLTLFACGGKDTGGSVEDTVDSAADAAEEAVDSSAEMADDAMDAAEWDEEAGDSLADYAEDAEGNDADRDPPGD